MTAPEPPPDPWTVSPAASGPPSPPPYAQQPWPTAPYGAPAGSWTGYPVGPKPRRRWVLWVVLAGVLVVGGCAAVIGTVGVKAYRVLDGSKAAVNDYLTAVEHGDQARAQSRRCDELLPEIFATSLEPGIVSHHVLGVAVASGGFGSGNSDETTASVTTEVTFAGGVHRRDVFTVVHEHGAWLVCGVRHGVER